MGLTIDKVAIVAIGSTAIVPYYPVTDAATTIFDVGNNDFLQRRRINGISNKRRCICDNDRRNMG